MPSRERSPFKPAIRGLVLEALRQSLSASRLSLVAQRHASGTHSESFHDMAQATDQMIDALKNLHETLESLTFALQPRDIDLSRDRSSLFEHNWP